MLLRICFKNISSSISQFVFNENIDIYYHICYYLKQWFIRFLSKLALGEKECWAWKLNYDVCLGGDGWVMGAGGWQNKVGMTCWLWLCSEIAMIMNKDKIVKLCVLGTGIRNTPRCTWKLLSYLCQIQWFVFIQSCFSLKHPFLFSTSGTIMACGNQFKEVNWVLNWLVQTSRCGHGRESLLHVQEPGMPFFE